MSPTLAILGGSAAYFLLLKRLVPVVETVSLETPYGPVPHLQRLDLGAGLECWFLSRHGQERYSVSAPFVNYRANLYALKVLGVERILSWSGPGSLRPERFHPGDLILPSDILDETRSRPSTFFQGKGWGFIRSHPTFCPGIQEAFRQAAAGLGETLAEGAVYVCTEGPRLETAAEVRKYAACGGDLVGMTLSPEAFLARELEMCYAPLTYVTNYAEGTVERPCRFGELFGGMLSEEERSRVDRCVDLFPALFLQAARILARMDRSCPCPDAMLRYRREGILSDDWRTWVDVAPLTSPENPE